MIHFNLNDISTYLSALEALFDIVRIVDPSTNQVVYQNLDGYAFVHGERCHEFWKKGKACDNCISTQVTREKNTVTKIEYRNDEVYLVMAAPIVIEECAYTMEFLKNITETGIIGDLVGLSGNEKNNIISELNRKVISDDLTKVYNRRYINQKLPMEMESVRRDKDTLTVIMLDIDCFKEINDVHGHLAGDMVLKELASTVKSKIRNNQDWIARYGGDEFFIILKNADYELTIKMMNEIKDAVENMEVVFNGEILHITISMGSCIVKSAVKDLESILYETDRNLKKAKEDGKNRIVLTELVIL